MPTAPPSRRRSATLARGAHRPTARTSASPRPIRCARATRRSAGRTRAPTATASRPPSSGACADSSAAPRADLATAARAVQDDLVVVDAEAQPAGEVLERALELVVLERRDRPAVVADHVVVVLAARMRGLVAGDAVADVEARDEPEPDELFERAVDARAPDLASAAPHRLLDVAGGLRAVPAEGLLDHREARPAAPQPRLLQPALRVLGPLCGHRVSQRTPVTRQRARPAVNPRTIASALAASIER